ncbi:MAG: 16S rRNA (cytosine(967)-C(5))-methyltransferase RsmB [Phascolarctobacterium sp.]|nr:16S rRNA (cytosine(967)-C(5))-methyltransferase RsmB [Phascolarctobacterium sp.]
MQSNNQMQAKEQKTQAKAAVKPQRSGFKPGSGKQHMQPKQDKQDKQAKHKALPKQQRLPKLPQLPVTSRAAALLVLLQVLEEGAYTNIAVNKYLRLHELSDVERRLFTELVYGTVKALGTLDWYLAKCVSRPLEQLDKAVLAVLRLAAYQLLYMERIPASAACNEAVKLTRCVSHEGSAKFVNGVLRGLLRKQEAGELAFPDEATDDAGYLALKYYHPRWLVKRWLGPWGREGTKRLLAFNNTAAPLCLRVNTLVTTREELLAQLAAEGAEVAPSQWSADGIVCTKLPPVSLTALLAKYKAHFYVQDESSMLVASVLAPEPGMQVLDLCSAPGGKTTHIAQLMQNKGHIMACDVHEHKLELIRENAQRLGISIIKPVLNDGTVQNDDWFRKFDRVLVDAPCSGMGVLRRRAEARWRKQRQDLKLFPPLQLEILENAASYVQQGGRLVYSTCTIEQAENHYLIEEFLARHSKWQRVPLTHPLTGESVSELQLLPQNDAVDGFYICALERK